MSSPPITGNEDLDSYLYNLASNLGVPQTSDNTSTYDSVTGEITDVEGNVIGYLYRYISVKYADDNVGTNLSNVPLNKFYFGIRNSDITTESTNPADYRWYAVDGGFGSSRSLFYKTTGGRTIRFDADTAAEDYTWLVDPGTAIDLDIIVPTKTISFNEIMDNTITELNIADLAVTAAKTNIAAIEPATGYLIANSVGPTQITDNAISAQKIQANAIVAGKIAANAVTASTIQASAITAVKIAADAVTADKIDVSQLSAISSNIGTITAGSITANTLTAGTSTIGTSGIKFGLGTTDKVNTYAAAGYFNSTTVLNSNYKFGLITTSTYGTALGVGSASVTYAGGFYSCPDINYNSINTFAGLAARNIAGRFENYNPSPDIVVEIANNSYGVQLFGSTVGAFTGAHDGLILKTSAQPELGDIIVDIASYAKPNINDSICINSISTAANQKGVVGVVSQFANENHVPSALANHIVDENNNKISVIDEAYSDINNYTIVIFNAIGEGLINVCGQNGDIEVGDLIVTSDIPGKGMKQSDDLVRNITVAKSREDITFSSPTEVKQIACIYLAG